jgi:multiple sugar transport system substrate-binding protein
MESINGRSNSGRPTGEGPGRNTGGGLGSRAFSRRWVLGAGATTLLTTGLTACGSDSDSGGGGGTLTAFVYGDDAVKVQQAAVDRFNKSAAAKKAKGKVKLERIPGAEYPAKLRTAMGSPSAPDIFFNWGGGSIKDYQEAKQVVDLTDTIENDPTLKSGFLPAVLAAGGLGGRNYGIPMRGMQPVILFYNKALFAEAGIANPPANLDELLAAALATTKRDGAGNITSAGITMDMAGQDHHWWREVLVRQNGGVPYDDAGNVAYNDAAGAAALKFYTDLQTEHKVGLVGFMDEGQAAFRAGLAAMTIDGTFRLGAFESNPFEWGVVELPADANGLRSNYSSYFANAIGATAEGEEKIAAEKFLAYISSPEAMEIWLDVVGELPARRDVAMTDANLADPVRAPFLKGLEYAHTTKFVDEAGQRQVAVDMVNRVLLENQAIEDSLAQAATAEQAIIDAAAK